MCIRDSIYGKKQQKEIKKKGKLARTPDPTIKEIFKLKKDLIKFDGEIKQFRETQKAFYKRDARQNGVKLRIGGLFSDGLIDDMDEYQKYLDAYKNYKTDQCPPRVHSTKRRQLSNSKRKVISLLRMARMPVKMPELGEVKKVKGLIFQEFKNLKTAKTEVANVERLFPKIEILRVNK
eukprot:TRINITY_DN12340_c0_g1_i2.p1 TRINITY_DN12340_c0_g1~~TRINITY_DN12340_c0_g1_i2.p1  ORF type:complete len:178 (-),score=44.56 TRINITY_DN12340_c0_g1_i2:97-630(-)